MPCKYSLQYFLCPLLARRSSTSSLEVSTSLLRRFQIEALSSGGGPTAPAYCSCLCSRINHLRNPEIIFVFLRCVLKGAFMAKMRSNFIVPQHVHFTRHGGERFNSRCIHFI